MAEWLQPVLLISLTAAAFAIGLALFRTGKEFPLLHPLLSSSALVALALYAFNISYSDYKQANQLLFFLLGTATVALAIPLHQQFHHVRSMILPLMVSLILGASFAALSAIAIAWLLGGSGETLVSISPKSVTTPIALGIAEKISAEPKLTAGIVAFTGVFGAIIAPALFRWLGIDDDRIKGFVMGINAHGVGTVRAFEISPQCGAFSSLALGLTGILTALLLPWLVLWFTSV